MSKQLGRLVVDAHKCTGCNLCEISCSFFHEKIFDPTVARIWVIKKEAEGIDYPVTCRLCLKAPCIEACPVEALFRDDKSDIVRLNSEKCICCDSCVEACPFGAITLHPKTKFPLVCDLCEGNPACVKKCVTGALRYIPIGRAIDLKARKTVDSISRSILRSWGVKK